MKKKLLFINGHLDTGGVEKSLLDILQHLDYRKYDADLLLTEHLGDYADQLPSQVHVTLRSIEGTYGPLPKVLLRSIAKRDWFSFRMRIIFLMMKLMGQKQLHWAQNLLTGGRHYDCVIAFRPGFCTQIAVYAATARRRITWWHHGEINIDPDTYLPAAQRCDRVVAVSDPCHQMLVSAFPQLERKLITVHNMLDASAVQQKAVAFDPYPEKNTLHIVSVGRLAPEKHFENTIYAAKRLKEQGISFRWHLVGDGILQKDLQALAAELGIMDCFIFEGNQVNPYPYMKHADLFVHPSYVESFGIVVTEALSLGIPCVITKSTGILDFLQDGENAVLTEQNPDDLTEKVLQILTATDLRKQLRKNARCPESFHPEAVMKKIENLLEAGV